jgi:hypothetical protein
LDENQWNTLSFELGFVIGFVVGVVAFVYFFRYIAGMNIENGKDL